MSFFQHDESTTLASTNTMFTVHGWYIDEATHRAVRSSVAKNKFTITQSSQIASAFHPVVLCFV